MWGQGFIIEKKVDRHRGPCMYMLMASSFAQWLNSIHSHFPNLFEAGFAFCQWNPILPK